MFKASYDNGSQSIQRKLHVAEKLLSHEQIGMEFKADYIDIHKSPLPYDSSHKSGHMSFYINCIVFKGFFFLSKYPEVYNNDNM